MSQTAVLPWFASVMYHRVVDEVAGDDPYALQISRQQFEQQLAWLRAQGYEAAAPGEALAAARAGSPALRRTVVLTFDDGYADFITHALPLLQKYRFTAVVMLVSGQIGGWNAWDEGRAARAPLMGKAEIRDAQAAGIRFGSHGRTHRRLPTLPFAEATAEIGDSKAALEDLLGAPVPVFCYPHGASSPRLREAVLEAGYVAAYGNTLQQHEPFELSRFDGARSAGAGPRWRFDVSGLHYRLASGRRALRRLLGGPGA